MIDRQTDRNPQKYPDRDKIMEKDKARQTDIQNRGRERETKTEQ